MTVRDTGYEHPQCLIEVVSGRPLDQFLRAEVFARLDMRDTCFYLPPEQADRLATVYGVRDGRLERAPDAGTMEAQGAYVDGPYFAGVLNGFHEKLGVQDAVLREQHALVWRGDPRLESFVRHHHPQVRSGSSGGMRASKADEDGVADGRKVQLRRPLRAGDGGGFGGYLIGG